MQKTELEVDKMRGQLIDVQDVRKLWGDIVSTVTQNLIHLPNKLAPQLRMIENQEVIADMISTGIRQILTELADTPLPQYAADTEEEESEDEDE